MRKAASAAVALAFAGSAFAADLPTKAPPMVAPAPASWTGWYIGINGGGVWGHTVPSISIVPGGGYAPISFPLLGAGVPATGSNQIGNSGGLFGAQVGYLWQSAWFVGGLEAAFDWMDARGSSANTTKYGFLTPTYTFNNNVSTNWLFTFLARAGVDMGAWYPYITGGLAVADLKYSSTFVDSFADPGRGLISISQTRTGWAIGGGAEWRWDSHWSLRGEYLYMDFDSFSGTMPVAQSNFPANITNLNYDVKFKENLARVALSYKF